MKTPLVSIIIPCYNQGQYLPEALQSVLYQTYTNWECIIVNDGSTDATKEIAEQWCVKDSRFVCLQKSNGGLSSARNAGLDVCKGEYVQFLDADDILDTSKLEKSIALINPKQLPTAVVSNFSMFEDEIAKVLLPPFCKLSQEVLNFNSILYNWDMKFSIPIHCGLFPRFIFDNINFNEELKAKEDWLFWLRIAQLDVEFKFLDENLAFYRIHLQSMTKSGGQMIENQVKAFQIIKKYVNEMEYEVFLNSRLEGYLNQITYLKARVDDLKKSNTHQFGLFCKKFLRKTGLLPLAKKLFEQTKITK